MMPWLVLAFSVGIGVADRGGDWMVGGVFAMGSIVAGVACRKGAVGFLCGILVLAGWVRFEGATPPVSPQDVAFYNDVEQTFAVEGWVADLPEVRPDRVRLVVEVDGLESVWEESGGESIRGRVLVSLPRYPDDYAYGQRIRFEGMLQTPAVFEDFSYQDHLRRYGIGSVVYEPSEFRVVESAPFTFYGGLYGLKAMLEVQLNRLFPEPLSSFAAGLLLGSRRSIPEEVLEAFNRVGLTHILAISGYNITLLITFIAALLKGVSVRVRVVVSVGVIVLFVLLVGASAAVVRAALMGILALAAVWVRRPREVGHLLFLSAGGMLLWNPFLLLDDVGFQLSFSATAGLIYASPWVEAGVERFRMERWIPRAFLIRQTLLSTVAAQLFSTPLLMIYFERFSLVAPLANVLVAPVIPVAMLVVFGALLFSFLVWPLGLFVAAFGALFLEWVLRVAEVLARLPLSSFDLSAS